MLEAKAKGTKKILGQGQECSRPRTKNTNASIFLRRNVFKKIFPSNSKKNGLEKHFSADLQNFNRSKNSAVLEPKTEQFSRPRPRISKCVLKAKDVLEDSTSASFTIIVVVLQLRDVPKTVE